MRYPNGSFKSHCILGRRCFNVIYSQNPYDMAIEGCYGNIKNTFYPRIPQEGRKGMIFYILNGDVREFFLFNKFADIGVIVGDTVLLRIIAFTTDALRGDFMGTAKLLLTTP